MEQSPYQIADEVSDHEQVDGVRVDAMRLVIAYAPDERHVEKIPRELKEYTDTLVEEHDRLEHEYSDGGRGAERHEWTGGVFHRPVLRSRNQPCGYELQVSLVFVG